MKVKDIISSQNESVVSQDIEKTRTDVLPRWNKWVEIVQDLLGKYLNDGNLKTDGFSLKDAKHAYNEKGLSPRSYVALVNKRKNITESSKEYKLSNKDKH